MTNPPPQQVMAGTRDHVFANVILDTTDSGEDVKVTELAVRVVCDANCAPSDTSDWRIFEGGNQLATINDPDSDIVTKTTNGSNATATFMLTTPLVISKGATKTLEVKADISSAATDGTMFVGMTDMSGGNVTAMGNTSANPAQVTLIPNNGQGQTFIPGGRLTITRDSSSPIAGLIPADSNGVILAIFNVYAQYEDINIEKMYVTGEQVNNGGWDQISGLDMYVVDGSGNKHHSQAVTPTTTDGIDRTVLFNSLITVPKDSGIKLIFQATTSESDGERGSIGESGQGIKLKFGSGNDVTARGALSGTRVEVNTTGASGYAQYLFRSVPIISQGTTGGQLIAGVETQKNLYQFSVAANSSGDIGLYYATFKLVHSDGVTIQNLKLYEGGTLIASKLIYQPAGDNMIIRNISVVPAGGTKNYFFKADVSCAGACLTSGSLAVSMLGDPQFPNTLPATIPGLDPYSHFGWTDFWLNPTLGAGAPGVTTTMAQWSNGYLVPLSNGSPMPVQSTPVSFTR